LVAVATDLGDLELGYRGHRWRWSCAVEASDTGTAEIELELGAAVVEQLRQPVVSWEIIYGHIVQSLLAGRLAEAEGLIERAQEAARAAGVPRRAAEAGTA